MSLSRIVSMWRCSSRLLASSFRKDAPDESALDKPAGSDGSDDPAATSLFAFARSDAI